MNSKQISVMNSFMKIHVPEFVREFMVSDNKHYSSCTEKFQPSATTAATVTRPMS